MPTGSIKRVAKVTISAPVTSFRYPHFVIGRQPTYLMPPPSTIWGHIASALGEWPAELTEFAYAFRYSSRNVDYEHQWIVTSAAQKKGIKNSANMNPCDREFLFNCDLELYVAPFELSEAFQSPAFAVVLGRSQDLASVRRVEVLELEQSQDGYLENTLLPLSFRRRFAWGATVTMPRWISPESSREAQFGQYIMLHGRAFSGSIMTSARNRIMSIQGESVEPLWRDPTSPEVSGGRRLLWFHCFGGESRGAVV